MPGANLTRTEAEERAGIVSKARYVVALDLTQGARTFVSDTTVAFDATEGASTFLDLIADEVQEITVNGTQLDPAEAYRDSRVELTGLQANNLVHVRALCRYSNTGEGMHRSVDPSDGNVYLYTQFEVPDARRVYAVFDQPDIKAVFDFTVDAPESWQVVSTMPVDQATVVEGATTAEGTLGDKPAERVRRWAFPSTPVMSSYLTAFVAGPYAHWHTTYANEDGRTIPMGIYCRQALKDAMAKDVDYLFDITKKGFAFYNAQWKVPYPYAKYDQLFVPEYNAGAMENIGTVTIRDSYVFESKVTDALADRRVETVLHELAHMWFGDLVTMKWWNDLWLNESFAEYMSTLATAEATEWKDEWATFCAGEKSWALRQDQLPTTHPIVAPINDLNDTYVNFDGITYAKGASVLKQIAAYVGRDAFFKGIHNYLGKHAYANATLADFLAELGAASGRDMTAWSKAWLETAGINTIAADVTEGAGAGSGSDADGKDGAAADGAAAGKGTIAKMTLTQSAPADHPTIRPHRLAVGFYDENPATGLIERTDRFELDVDGETTEVTAVAGKRRPAFILPNDDDLTYAKIRFDKQSLAFAEANLYRFADPLARAVIWLAFWDMTRDGEYPAERFIGLSLKALATEKQSTTFRYALAQMSTAAHHYVPRWRRDKVLSVVAAQLWHLACAAKAGSDEQFQLVRSYLGYGDDADFETNVRAMLRGDLKLDGLEIDNNLRWALIQALAEHDLLADGEIDRELARRDTTENREFAAGARASIPTAKVKAKAWDDAQHDENLTNAQIESVCYGFNANSREDLYEEYVDKYYEAVDWIWKNRTFHMAEVLIGGLYPSNADPAALVVAGERWLAEHEDADWALKRMILENVDSSRRTARVQSYNTQLG